MGMRLELESIEQGEINFSSFKILIIHNCGITIRLGIVQR